MEGKYLMATQAQEVFLLFRNLPQIKVFVGNVCCIVEALSPSGAMEESAPVTTATTATDPCVPYLQANLLRGAAFPSLKKITLTGTSIIF